MKAIYFLLFILFLSVPVKECDAQGKKSNAAAIAAGAIAGVASVSMSIHQFNAMIELKAADHIMQAYPDLKAFNVKTLDIEGKKISDIGAMSVVTFRLTELAPKNHEELSRNVLLMITSDGWVNSNGIDFKYVTWKRWTTDSWNRMFWKFCQINTPCLNEGDGRSYKDLKEIRKKDYNSSDSTHFSIGNEYYIKDEKMKTRLLSDGRMSRKGITHEDMKDGMVIQKLTLPFYVFRDDTYLTANYDNEYKIFSNEKSMGLFLVPLGRSIQLQRSLVSKIHLYLNGKAFKDIKF